MDSEIIIGGLHVPLEQTSFGARVGENGDDDIELLRWVVNAALDGELPGFAESIQRGESRTTGIAQASPLDPSEDREKAEHDWHEKYGGALGANPYAVGVQWRGRLFVLPGEVLADLIRRLQATSTQSTQQPAGPWLFTTRAIHHEPSPE